MNFCNFVCIFLYLYVFARVFLHYVIVYHNLNRIYSLKLNITRTVSHDVSIIIFFLMWSV